MSNIEFIKVGTIPAGKYNSEIDMYNIQFTVDIRIGDIEYKDVQVSIPEETIKSLIWRYETH